MSDYLIGNHTRAVAILVCEGGPGVGGGQLWDRYAGSWAGDRIVLAVDTGEPPNPVSSFGVQTSTLEEPDRNLFGMVFEEFENISYAMLILVCGRDREFAEHLLARTSSDDLYYLWHFGNALALHPESLGSDLLRKAVLKRFGPDWEQLHQAECIRWQEILGDSHTIDEAER